VIQTEEKSKSKSQTLNNRGTESYGSSLIALFNKSVNWQSQKNGSAFFISFSRIWLLLNIVPMLGSCLEPGKIGALKMLDLQTKSAINSNNLQV